MSKNKKNLIRIIVTAAAFVPALVTYILFEDNMPFWAWLIVFVAIYLAIGYDVLFRAARNIIHGKVFDENFLMIVATIGAFAIGEYAESVAVMLFYQSGEFFQSYAVGKSRKSISELMDICPETACLLTEEGESTVYPDEVEIGSVVVVRPGERVPIDGIIIEGEGVLDCSALTGESLPVKKKVGDEALSGAINISSVIKIRTQKKYEDSTVAKILDLVENASAKKAKTERFITRFAAVYTPVVVGLAVLIAVLPPLVISYSDGAVWSEWISRALTFLVVSCPCAFVISVPLSFFGGIGAASKRGILVKGGNYLEILNKTDTLVLDKTGTITKGSFEVVRVVGDRKKVLSAAAAAEKSSIHPIALSIVSAAEKDGFSISDTLSSSEVAGRGVCAKDGNRTILCGSALYMEENGVKFSPVENAASTLVYVAENLEYLGAIEIADAVKDDSAAALSALKAMSVKTVMLTGDRREAARAVASSVGIDEVHAELLPNQKVERIEAELNADSGEKRGAVAFVGDGINDAPVLSRADLGIAMGALGSDAAIEAADIVLMNDSLMQIVTAKRIAKKTVAIVIQNIVFALGVKIAALVLAALGIASIWIAVFADVGVAVLAILNAMRALRVKDVKTPESYNPLDTQKAAIKP
ncbi:MAG: cadmium-translocating P-type ATPase [Clostridiales bacterium]|nr:cadmium-translocating P-type ATPase [Clostridiales bacterium]